MKKLLFTAFLSLLAVGVFGQKKTLKSAQKAYNKKTYDEAITLATEAASHVDTKDNPNVYIIMGKSTLYKYEQDNTDFELAQQAYDYFMVAIEKGGEKVESKLMEEVYLNPTTGRRLTGGEALRFLELFIVSQGNIYFDEGEYAKAYNFFELATKIIDNVDYEFYAGYSAQNGGLVDSSLGHFEKVLAFHAKEEYKQASFAYNGLIDYYNTKDDWDNALKYIEEAQASFPDEKLYDEYKIDVLIRSERMDEAVASLTEVIEKGGANASQYYALAFLQWSDEKMDEAQAAALKAAELQPDHHDALNIAATVYFNKAAALLKEANNETDDEKFMAKKDQALALFKTAMPLFEKASEVKPEELAYLNPLSTIYDQLEMDDKRDAILKRMEALEGGE